MRDFSKIAPTLWHSERFNSLASDDAKLTLLYLLTSEHQNSAGCYRLPDAYAAADLRWPLERYLKARAELEKADLILFDAAASVVMIRRWFKFNAPMNAKHLTGIRNILQRLPSQPIWEAASAELDEITEANAKAAEAGSPTKARGGAGANPWAGWKPKAA